MTDPIEILEEHGVLRRDAKEALASLSVTQAAALIRFSGGKARSLPETRALLSMALKCPNEWNAVGVALERRNKV